MNLRLIRTVCGMSGSKFSKRFAKRNTTATTLLAANVRRLRLAKKMTQDDLAAVSNVEQREISLIENERANPTVVLLDSIANALSAEMSDLFESPINSSANDGSRRGSRRTS